MPFSSGTYSLPSGNPVVTGTTISSSTTNTTNSDIATALSSCILKDGTQTVTANIPMASHKITGLSAGTTAGDSVEYGGSPSFTNLAYTGTLTGSTGILNIGSGQVYKDASGNVGIGTSSPSVNLNVYKSSDGIAARFQRSSGGGLVDIETYNGIGGIGTADNIPFRLNTNNTERMRIDSSGNVGIGTASPTSKMEVAVGTAGGSLNITNTANTNTPKLRVTTSQSSMDFGEDGTGGFIEQLGAYPIRFYNNNSERMRIDSSGNLLVGTTSNFGGRVNISLYQSGGQYGVVMRPSADISSPFNFQNAAGTQIGGINCTSSATAYATSSDQRLKENIVNSPSALASVNAIKVRSFDWKVDGSHQDYGYIAQELLEVAPEAVSVPTNEDEMMGVDFGKLTPRLVKAIQELKAIIDTQQEQINSLLGK